MIIWIDESFGEIDLEKDAIGRDAVEAVCAAAARGHHFLFGPRAVLKSIAEFRGLSQTAKGIISEIIDQYAFMAGLVNRLTYRVDVRRNLQVVERIGETYWAVPASQIADHGVRPTVLLAENSRDAEIYVYAAKHFQISENLNDIKICIEPRNGNGAGISAELEKISERAVEWCLCITDGDIEFPGGTRGIIANACSRVVEKRAHAVSRHVYGEGRELENVIPRRLFAEVAEEIHQVEWQKYKDCEGRVGEEVLQYVDLKNGIRFCDLFSKSLNSPERIYWIEKMNNCYADVGCVGDGGCDKSENEQCVILGGFGGRIAEHVQSNMAKKSIRKIFDVAKVSNNFESWLNIGRDVFFAAAAPKKLRV